MALLGQEKCIMKLIHFVPPSNEMLKSARDIRRAHKNQFKGVPMDEAQDNLSIKTIIVTYCTPLSKTESHDPWARVLSGGWRYGGRDQCDTEELINGGQGKLHPIIDCQLINVGGGDGVRKSLSDIACINHGDQQRPQIHAPYLSFWTFFISPIYFPTIYRYFLVPEFDLFTLWLNGTCPLRLFFLFPIPSIISIMGLVCCTFPHPNCSPNQ